MSHPRAYVLIVLMSHFQITGGIPLSGQVFVGGAKNAALPIMAAAILASEPVRLENVPRVTDVQTQARVLWELGLRVKWENDLTDAVTEADKNVCPTVSIETVDRRSVNAPERLVRRMRASFCVLGPLLARRGKAVVPLPGGCNIGNRPVDLHLRGLAALGADIRLEHGCVVAEVRRLVGADIDLGGPNGSTVTGTANVMSAAVLARGVTTIRQAAIEPEIVDLGTFLIALGANISGLGTPTIRIEGVEQLGGTTHRLTADRIEAATLLMATAITGGSAMIAGIVPEHLGEVLALLRAAGTSVDVGGNHVCLEAPNRLQAVDVIARPYPGVPTDVQALWTAVASLADGVSRVRDTVFPGRFLHAAELNRLGADIACQGDTAIVTGVRHLSGARVTATDLRAGAALVLAGLAAEGRTVVDHVHHLDRGYEELDEKLRALGARIQRMPQPAKIGMPSATAASFSGSSRLASGEPFRKASSR